MSISDLVVAAIGMDRIRLAKMPCEEAILKLSLIFLKRSLLKVCKILVC